MISINTWFSSTKRQLNVCSDLNQQQKTNHQMPMQMGGTPLQQKVAPWSASVPSGSPVPQMPPGTPNARLPAQTSGVRALAMGLHEQLERLRQTAAEQIQVSENNLSAQYQNLMQQQQVSQSFSHVLSHWFLWMARRAWPSLFGRHGRRRWV